MTSFLARFRSATAELGALNAWLYAAGRALAALTGGRARLFKYYFVEQPVAAKDFLPASRGRNIALRWLTAYDPVLASTRPSAVLHERFAGGAVCLVAEIEGRFCGFLWINLDCYREDEVRSIYRPIPSGQSAWDFDVYIEPAQRMGFVFLRMWDECNRFLRERGVRSTFSRISAFNPGSIAAHSRLGTRRVGSAIFLRAGSLELLACDFRPYVHLSWSKAGTPTLRLHSKAAAS